MLAGGPGKLAGQIFRIRHLGWVSEADLQATVERLRSALPRLGDALPEAPRAG